MASFAVQTAGEDSQDSEDIFSEFLTGIRFFILTDTENLNSLFLTQIFNQLISKAKKAVSVGQNDTVGFSAENGVSQLLKTCFL